MAKTALIMEGGAMRGMFTCGVMDVLMEHGITFDAGAGISAGAVFGCNYKSGQIGRPLRYNKTYCRDARYCSARSLLTTGDLYGVKFCYETLPDRLDVFDRRTFAANPMRFYVGATDLAAGHLVCHECTDGGAEDLLWMRASASMPLVSRPVRIGGRDYLDGGIAEPVPYRFMQSLGYDRCVVVLTQPAGYRKPPASGLTAMRAALAPWPEAYGLMAARHIRYNAIIAYVRARETEGEALVICPPAPLGIGRIEKDPDRLQAVYDIGRAEAERRLADVERFLGA